MCAVPMSIVTNKATNVKGKRNLSYSVTTFVSDRRPTPILGGEGLRSRHKSAGAR